MVEASSHENVNVDAAFFAVAQLVDKSRGRTRILSYYEAAMGRRQMMDEATDNYLRLIWFLTVQWVKSFLKKLSWFHTIQMIELEFREKSQLLSSI